MRYTARKILTLLVTMLVVSLLTFAAFAMISGDPAATLLGTQATPEKVEALRTEMGLNRPMLVRYGEWLAGFFTGNLGVSFHTCSIGIPLSMAIVASVRRNLCG